MEIYRTLNNLRRIADQVIDIVRFQALEKSLELVVNIALDVPALALVDPIRLNQILVNLLGNAVKFTTNGKVELEIEFKQTSPANGLFSFYVKDTGIGISEEEQKKLFKAFSQADSSATRKFGGTGLGLVISAKLAEAMGSRIEFESSPGKGSTFYFTLETGFKMSEIDEIKNGPIYPAEAPSSDSDNTSVNPLIIVAENDSMSMLLVKTLIKKLVPEARLIETKNGLEAFNAVKKEKPDIIFMDVQMPEMDGLEATRNIRLLEQKAGGHIPVVALSAGVIKEEQDTCIQAGMDDFLAKPIDRQSLQKVLNKYLG
jgi:CheY-like chemotaxis protein